jgi:hypothetical protein
MPPRPRSPCKDIKRRLPNYKALARDLKKNSKETVPRYRYQAGPEGVPCNVVSQDAPGRTTCYAADAHSSRRKTCTLLVDPEGPFAPTFPPGFYLYGHDEFKDHNFICNIRDYILFTSERVNTFDDTVDLPEKYSVGVLGPFVHPITNKLVVKCIPLAFFNYNMDLTNPVTLGYLFESMESGAPDPTIMVPTVKMLIDFCRQLDDVSEKENRQELGEVAVSLRLAASMLEDAETECKKLADECDRSPEFLRKARTILRCFYELALYSRRWAGPDMKVPIMNLPEKVGSAQNPLSPKIRNKFVSSSQTGVKLASLGEVPADLLDGKGMLTTMQMKLGESILKIYNTLTEDEQKKLVNACYLGYPFWKIDGSGYWLSDIEPNTTDPPFNGNPPGFSLSLFSMYFGNTSRSLGFFAYSSVQGGEGDMNITGYCYQIASNFTGRSVLTIMKYLYKSRPLWAAAEGPWVSMHD